MTHKSPLIVLLAAFAGTAMGQDEQSPIRIDNRSALLAPHHNRIEFYYDLSATVSVVNTYGAFDNLGRLIPREFATLKVNVPAGSFIYADGVRYDLQQFHFHTPSEHTINGLRMPMEVHFVHLNVQGCVTPRPVVVVGVGIVPGAADKELQKIFALQTLPANGGAGSQTIMGVNLSKLLPDGQASWNYEGSLTAPSTTCNSTLLSVQLATEVFPEIVRWYVKQEIVHLPGEMIHKFQDLFPDGNTRAAQELHGRPVFRDQKQH